MIGAFHVGADKFVEVFITLNMIAWLAFPAAILVKRFLPENLSGQPDAVAEISPVFFMRHVVEQYGWSFPWISRIEGNLTA